MRTKIIKMCESGSPTRGEGIGGFMAENGVTTKRLRSIARDLRINQTSAEMALWRALRRKQLSGFRFRRQVPLCGFVVDFACTEARLVVEVDGATHSTDEELENDTLRDAKLSANSNSVFRFTNDEIYRNLDGVVETIWLKLRDLRPRTDASSLQRELT